MQSPALRKVLRTGYRAAVGAATLAALPMRARDGRVAVNYAGARRGDVGGTLVKVRLLNSRFPEQRVGFSVLYVLSNSVYMPESTYALVRRAGVPIVLNQNGIYYRGWYPHGWERENRRIQAVHGVASHIFYQSEFCRRCAERFVGPRSGSAEILNNAVDIQHFSPSADDRARGGSFTFLVTGKIGVETGYRVMSSIAGLAAARRGGLDVRLTIAGVVAPSVLSQAVAEVERLALGDAVSFTGRYTGVQAPAIYQAADAYLMTKYNDPCPNAVIEALACGLPVLYSASGGVPELVGEDAGVGLPMPETFEQDLVPEPEAIAEGMARVMRGREAMARAARARAVERFNLDRWFERHQAVFSRLAVEARSS